MKIIALKIVVLIIIIIPSIALLGLTAGCAGPPAPVAAISVNKSVIATGEAVQFSDQSGGEVKSWSWDFGDSLSSSEQNPSHSYATGGDFFVTLTAANKAGSSSSKINIKVLQTPAASFSTAKNVAAIGESIQFTDKSTGDIALYSWDFGDGFKSTDPDPSHSYNRSGSFTVSLQISNELSGATKTTQVKILNPVKADIAASTAVAQTGTAVQFTDKSSGDIASRAWDFGDGFKSTETNPSHTYKSSGSFTASLQISNELGSDTKTVQVKIIDPIKADFTASTALAKTGAAIQFTDKSTGAIASRAWDFGDGYKSTETNPSHSYDRSGSFNVSLQISNELGSDTKTVQVKIFNPAKADFTVSTTTSHPGIAVQFTDKSSGYIETWAWDFGDGAKSTEKNPKHAYSSSGSYTVTLTVGNTNGSDTLIKKDQISVSISKLFLNLIMCSEVTGYGDYKIQPDATFTKGQPVFVYVELRGFMQKVVSGGGYAANVQVQSVKVYDPYGVLWLDRTNYYKEWSDTAKTSFMSISFWFPLGSVSGTDSSGEYTVEITILDKLSADNNTATKNFTIK